MAFTSAGTSFVRYRIPQQIEQPFWSEVLDRLKRFAFVDIDDTADERSFGWVSFDNMLETDWHSASPEKGIYLTFSLRLDTRRIPAAVFKKHFQIALTNLKEQMQASGKKFVSKDQKTELKEQVMLRLRSRFLPIPAYFEVVWNTTNNIVFFGSTRDKMCELFVELFHKTFGIHLERQTPFWLGLQLAGTQARGSLESIEPTTFI